MIPHLMAALRAAIPGAGIRLLDAAPSPHLSSGPQSITVRLLVSTQGLEAEYEAVLAKLMRHPGLNVNGQSIRVVIVPASIDEKARLWLSLGMPFVPGILLEAGPLEI